LAQKQEATCRDPFGSEDGYWPFDAIVLELIREHLHGLIVEPAESQDADVRCSGAAAEQRAFIEAPSRPVK
jgi:hypothetical protein